MMCHPIHWQLATLALVCTVSSAQQYPTKPIRIINTVAAGGPAELVARIVGQRLTDAWGQQVVIDTRAGAGGIIGAEIAARAAPDGYTLLLGRQMGEDHQNRRHQD